MTVRYPFPLISPTLAYDIPSLAAASKLGKQTVFDAIAAGELETFRPIVGGRKLRRRLISIEAADAWIAFIQGDKDAA